MMRGTFLSLIIRRTAWSLGLAVLSSAPLRASDPPEATITAPSGAVTATVNQTIPFTATSSNAAGYDLYTVNSYAWTFGDGTTGASASTSHAYTTAGTYTVTLTVNYTGKTCSRMDQNGNCTAYQGQPKTATTTRTITVQPPPAITSFSASSSTVEVGKPVTLSWATTNATSLSISGVGTVTGTSVTVSPTATTTYTLTATGGGASATASVTVSTYTLSVTISPGSASLLLGGSQAFTGSVNPANQGLSWNATGGSLSGSTFTATASGTFTVSVASAEDPTRTASATVTVASVSVAAPVPTPSSAQTFVGGTVSFSALVSGAVNKGVTWSVSGGGSISAAGVFTASTKGAWTVTAKSLADPTKTATTTLTVVPLVVTALPATSTVKSGETETLTATVTGPGTPSQGVTWSVVTAGGGTIVAATGVYTAPATAGDYVVKATSIQDPTCFGTTTIHVPGWTLVWKKDVLYVGAKEIAEVDASGKTWVEFDDHLGSPRYEWDGTAVASVDNVHLIAQKYGPFGEYLNDPATQAKFEKGFTNHEQTDPSGLIYMQARFYAPMYGRFLSPDPARDQHFEETQSWNIYSYVQNDPTMRIDPTGMVNIFKDDYNALKQGIKNFAIGFGRGLKSFGKDTGSSLLGKDTMKAMGVDTSTKGESIVDAGKSGSKAESFGHFVGALAPFLIPGGGEEAGGARLGAEASEAANLSKAGEAGLGGAQSSKVDAVLKGIDELGAKVEINPKSAATQQEGNATIHLPDNRSVNVRVETHPIPGSGGKPVRHGNVDVLKPAKNKTVPIRKTHITD